MTRFRPHRLAAGLLPALLLAFVPATYGQEMELPRPGKEHAMLKKDAGTWDAKVKMWMGPGDPVESKGTETNTMLGDLWLLSQFEGEIAGMPFKGHGQNGYDTVKKKFVVTWVDTFSTSPTILEGTYDEKTGELTMTGDSIGPDGSKMEMKQVTKHGADGSRVFTMFMKGDMTGGEWVKSMEVTYTRRDKAAH
jgi:hypothetical protein